MKSVEEEHDNHLFDTAKDLAKFHHRHRYESPKTSVIYSHWALVLYCITIATPSITEPVNLEIALHRPNHNRVIPIYKFLGYDSVICPTLCVFGNNHDIDDLEEVAYYVDHTHSCKVIGCPHPHDNWVVVRSTARTQTFFPFDPDSPMGIKG